MVEADLKARVIFIPNAIKYNKPQSPNVVKSWASHWDEMPECDLKSRAYSELKAFIKGLGEGFVKAFEEAIGKPYRKTMPNQEQKQEQKIISCEAFASPVPVLEKLSIADTPPKNSLSKEVNAIFLYWQQIMKHPQAKLDKKRQGKIGAALRLGFNVDQLKQAIDGCGNTPFNVGINDRGQRYDSIDLIFRDADHIERFIAASRSYAPAKIANSSNPIFAGVL